MNVMTNHLRAWLAFQAFKRKMSIRKLTKVVTVTGRGEPRHPSAQYISKVLSGETADMPEIWESFLDSFDHSLLVIPNNKRAEVIQALLPIIGDDVPPNVLKELMEGSSHE